MSTIASDVQESGHRGGDDAIRRGFAGRLWAAGAVVLVVLAAVLAIGFVASGSDDRDTSLVDHDTSLVDDVVAAWNANDMEALHELYDPAAVVEANGNVYTGIESVHEAAAAFATAEMQLRRVSDVTREGNVVAARFEVRWPDGSGHATHRTHIHITEFEFENGRIVHERSY